MESKFTTRKTPGNTEWFVADRFGMFIHWGLYAMAARHEWVKFNEKISEKKYQKYFHYFDPDLYNPQEWAQMAKNAGMKYVVITTKHHEGFCLWDSQYTDYKAANTPAGRDLIHPFVEAFRAEGLKIGFYYSLIDWHHPEFPVDILHPRNMDQEYIESNKTRDVKKYAEFMRNQVRELLTNYGKIDILWFDFSYSSEMAKQMMAQYFQAKVNLSLNGKGKDDWESEELIRMVRELQPEIIIDNRADIEQDLWTPEQFQPREWVRHEETGELVVWETCQTFSGSWGYYRDELTWKSPEMLVRMLINTVSCGGNLLLNVGPTSRGVFDYRAEAALSAIGEWMKKNSRSIYDCTASKYLPPADCRYTQNGNHLYLHIFAWPYKQIYLQDLAGKIDYAQFLHDGSEVLFNDVKPSESNFLIAEGKENEVVLDLPVIKPNVLVPVIELFLRSI